MKKKYKNYQSQYFVRHECVEKGAFSFGMSMPDLQKLNVARLLKFAETVVAVRGKLKKNDYHVTIGMKLVKPKTQKFYGTYVKYTKETLLKFETKEELASALIDGAVISHKKLEKNLYKYKLKDGHFPKPAKTI